MAIIMGVDPGTRYVGFGILDTETPSVIAYGTIVADQDEFSKRLQIVGSEIRKIIKKYNPNTVVVEKIFLGKNADSAFKLGHARGIIFYEAALNKIEIIEYAAREVKKGVTGHGNAEKEQVRNFVLNSLKIRSNGVVSFDATDALALALFHSLQSEVKAQFKKRGINLDL